MSMACRSPWPRPARPGSRWPPQIRSPPGWSSCRTSSSEGPCWDADLTGAPQRADLADHEDSRWPEFGPAAREIAGGRTVYGLPMRPQSRVLGVLSVHLGEPGDLPRGLEAGLFVADAVGAALLLDPQGTDTSPVVPARGRVGRRSTRPPACWSPVRIPAVDALAVLRAHAFAENTTLDDIASRVLSATLVFGKDALHDRAAARRCCCPDRAGVG